MNKTATFQKALISLVQSRSRPPVFPSLRMEGTGDEKLQLFLLNLIYLALWPCFETLSVINSFFRLLKKPPQPLSYQAKRGVGQTTDFFSEETTWLSSNIERLLKDLEGSRVWSGQRNEKQAFSQKLPVLFYSLIDLRFHSFWLSPWVTGWHQTLKSTAASLMISW